MCSPVVYGNCVGLNGSSNIQDHLNFEIMEKEFQNQKRNFSDVACKDLAIPELLKVVNKRENLTSQEHVVSRLTEDGLSEPDIQEILKIIDEDVSFQNCMNNGFSQEVANEEFGDIKRNSDVSAETLPAECNVMPIIKTEFDENYIEDMIEVEPPEVIIKQENNKSVVSESNSYIKKLRARCGIKPCYVKLVDICRAKEADSSSDDKDFSTTPIKNWLRKKQFGLRDVQADCASVYDFCSSSDSLNNSAAPHGTFDCVVCNEHFSGKSQYDHHLRAHRNAQTRKCTYCNKTFKTEDLCLLHEIKKTCLKYQCRTCFSIFGRADELEHHMVRHSLSVSFATKNLH